MRFNVRNPWFLGIVVLVGIVTIIGSVATISLIRSGTAPSRDEPGSSSTRQGGTNQSALALSEVLYAGTSQGISAVRAIDGRVLHTYPPASVFTIANGFIYVVTEHEIVALKISNGEQAWSVPNDIPVDAIIATQGTVFVSLSLGNHLIYALDSHTGTLKWRKTIDTLGSAAVRMLASSNSLQGGLDSGKWVKATLSGSNGKSGETFSSGTGGTTF